MDVSKEPKAKELASRLGINAVPYFLYAGEDGKVCTLKGDGNVGKCVKEDVGNTQKR